VRLSLAHVLVDEDDVLTAGTVSAGLNLALYLVARHAGVEVAALTAKSLAVDKNREQQLAYLIPALRLDGGDELVERAQRWIEAQTFAEGSSRITGPIESIEVAWQPTMPPIRQSTIDSNRNDARG
jgi:transcriptional regulator GlxA family with amidase domain